MAKYFSQRFAQVTNPPLDSLREADGMSMRVALGAKPDGGEQRRKQIVLSSPILGHLDMVRLREQRISPLRRFDLLFEPDPADADRNAESVVAALDALCDEVTAFARDEGGIALLSDRAISTTRAPIPLLLAIAAVNQRLIDDARRWRQLLAHRRSRCGVACTRLRRLRGVGGAPAGTVQGTLRRRRPFVRHDGGARFRRHDRGAARVRAHR